MDLPIQPDINAVSKFDELEWDKQELDLMLDSLEQEAFQLQRTAELVVKFAKRVAQR